MVIAASELSLTEGPRTREALDRSDAHRRTDHAHLHIRGYKEAGNVNTPL